MYMWIGHPFPQRMAILKHTAPQLALRVAALPRRLWPVAEAAHVLGISRATLWRHAKDGKVRIIPLGHRRLIPDSEVIRISTEGLA
jgi:excisionase family DNA binding protein